MILVIALIVLGPDKLPSAARRIGGAWSDFQRWRAHLEGEMRATFPDLPSTTEIARAVRSPMTLLDRLAEEHGAAAAPLTATAESPSLGAAAPGATPAAAPAAEAEQAITGFPAMTASHAAVPAGPAATVPPRLPEPAGAPVMTGGSSAN
jgi:Sec-independent protein translocase protein TatA